MAGSGAPYVMTVSTTMLQRWPVNLSIYHSMSLYFYRTVNYRFDTNTDNASFSVFQLFKSTIPHCPLIKSCFTESVSLRRTIFNCSYKQIDGLINA